MRNYKREPTVPQVLEAALLLRAEGASLLAMSVLLYWINEASWVLFALLFLAPDVSLLAYVVGPRVEAAATTRSTPTCYP